MKFAPWPLGTTLYQCAKLQHFWPYVCLGCHRFQWKNKIENKNNQKRHKHKRGFTAWPPVAKHEMLTAYVAFFTSDQTVNVEHSTLFVYCTWHHYNKNWCQAQRQNCSKKRTTKSAASAAVWRRKAHYQVVLLTFSSFPLSAVQRHLCVDVWERERERERGSEWASCPQSRCAKWLH